MSLNKVLLIGNLGKEPEVKHLEGGATVTTFTLATTERFKDRSGESREITEWHTIVCWRALADFAGNYLHRGSQVFVEGKITSRSWEDKDGEKHSVTEIVASRVDMLDKKPREEKADAPAPRPVMKEKADLATRKLLRNEPEEMDDLPF